MGDQESNGNDPSGEVSALEAEEKASESQETEAGESEFEELQHVTNLNTATETVLILLLHGLVDTLVAKGVLEKGDLKLIAEDAIDSLNQKLQEDLKTENEELTHALVNYAEGMIRNLFEPYDIFDAQRH